MCAEDDPAVEQGSSKQARPLKIGLQLPEVEYAASWRDYLELARIAEAIGIDSLWLGDHLLYRYPGEPARGPWECWSLLSALAAVTAITLDDSIDPLIASSSTPPVVISDSEKLIDPAAAATSPVPTSVAAV